MKISIISTVYNKEKFLKEHIESLLNQTYDNIEFIFVDDGSTDKSFEILNKYKDNSKVKIISQENKGPNIARKVGFLSSKGDYVYFVDSDDKLYDGFVISNIIEILEKNQDIDFIIGQMYNAYDSKNILDKIIYCDDIHEGIYNINYLYDKSFRLSLCYKIIKRTIIKEEDFLASRVYEDGFLTYKIYDRAKKFYYYENPIYIVNRKKENNNRITTSINIEKVIEKYNTIKSLEYLDNFSISLKKLYLQSCLDDLNYALKLKYKDKIKILKIAKENLKKSDCKKEYLILNKHYKTLYKLRFFYSKPTFNSLFYYIKTIKKILIVIKKFIIKFLRKIVLFFSTLFIKLSKKFKIIFYRIKYGKRLSIGKNINFRKNFIINISKTGNLKIGNNNFFNNYCTINCQNNIMIGDDNIFGENVKFYDHDHLFNDLSKDIKSNFNKGRIIIGNDNWIGTNSVILRDTYLGNKNVIGAGVILKGKYDNNKLIKGDRKVLVEDIVYKKEGEF